MGSDQSVRCQSTSLPTGAFAIAALLLTGLVVAVITYVPHPEEYERYGPGAFPGTLLIFGGALVLTLGFGVLRLRYAVRTVEFTRSRVRLESRARVRTVPVTDLGAVRVSHSGHTDSGYEKTSLEMRWRDGTHTIHCDHDPTLAEALTRLLPPHVEVTDVWNDLVEPDPS